jgi:uncharacterized membrane protein HdeD (DUF308 family)
VKAVGAATASNEAREVLLAAHAQVRTPGRNRARGLRAAGLAIILLGVGAALLPAGKSISSDLVGGLLVAAGLIETVAGSLRSEARRYAVAAGVVTTLAGLLFILNPTTHFFPNVTPVIAWLLIRSLILALATRLTENSVRMWTIISAGVDLLLGLLLMAGLSIATIVISVFGPTEPLVASFAWFLAVSFVANGLLLLEVSSCEREQASA